MFASLSDTLKLHTWPDLHDIYSHKSRNSSGAALRNISFAKDGSILVLLTENGLAELFQLKNSELKYIQTVRSVPKPTWASFSNTTKKVIAFGTEDGKTVIYDVKSKKEVKNFQKGTASVYKVEYMATDNHIVSGYNNGELRVYNSKKNVLSALIRHPTAKICAFSCPHAKPNLLCSGLDNGNLAIWDINTNKLLRSVATHVNPVKNVICSHSQPNLLISLSITNNLCLYDINSNSAVARIPENFAAADVCPRGISLAVGTTDGVVLNYDFRNLKETVKSVKMHDATVKQIAFQKVLKDNCTNSMLQISEEEAFQSCSNTSLNNLQNSFDLYEDCSSVGKKDKVQYVDSFLCTTPEYNSTSCEREGSKLLKSSNKSANKLTLFSPLNEKLMASARSSFREHKSKSYVLSDVTNAHKTPAFEAHQGKHSGTTSTPIIQIQPKISIEESPILHPVLEKENEAENEPLVDVNSANLAGFKRCMLSLQEDLVLDIQQIVNRAQNKILLSQISEAISMENLYGKLKEDLLADTVKIYTNSEHVAEMEALKRENAILRRENVILTKEVAKLKGKLNDNQ